MGMTLLLSGKKITVEPAHYNDHFLRFGSFLKSSPVHNDLTFTYFCQKQMLNYWFQQMILARHQDV